MNAVISSDYIASKDHMTVKNESENISKEAIILSWNLPEESYEISQPHQTGSCPRLEPGISRIRV